MPQKKTSLVWTCFKIFLNVELLIWFHHLTYTIIKIRPAITVLLSCFHDAWCFMILPKVVLVVHEQEAYSYFVTFWQCSKSTHRRIVHQKSWKYSINKTPMKSFLIRLTIGISVVTKCRSRSSIAKSTFRYMYVVWCFLKKIIYKWWRHQINDQTSTRKMEWGEKKVVRYVGGWM